MALDQVALEASCLRQGCCKENIFAHLHLVSYLTIQNGRCDANSRFEQKRASVKRGVLQSMNRRLRREVGEFQQVRESRLATRRAASNGKTRYERHVVALHRLHAHCVVLEQLSQHR